MQLEREGETRFSCQRMLNGRRGLPIVFASILLVISAMAGFAVARGESTSFDVVSEKRDTARAGSLDSAADVEKVVVDVDGAVVNPGVYRLDADDRVGDALDAAGGAREDAVLDSINRASKLVDGQKIHVPSAIDNKDGGVFAPIDGDSSGTASSGLVSINTAGIEELDQLQGIGPSTARAIIEDREANGPFASIDDLMRVSGIGEKKFSVIKDQLCL